MGELERLALAITVFYIIPTVFCFAFAVLHNNDNPFKDDGDSCSWVFMPVGNCVCMAVIVYYLLVELPIRWICKHGKELVKRFEKWNKG